MDDIHAVDHVPENDVLVVQPLGFHRADEELRTVGIWAGVGHREDSRFGVLELEVLILEFVAKNTLPTPTVTPREVAPLAHELGDDTVEAGPFVAELGRRAGPF